MVTPTPTPTTSAMTLSGDLTGVRPWEDRTCSAKERYDSYMAVVRVKCEALLAAGKRKGVTQDERIALAFDPANRALVEEFKQLKNETPEEFCQQRDGELLRELLGKNFLGAEEWQRGFKVDVGKVPPIPTWITKELLEEDCQLHPGQQMKDAHILMLVPKTVGREAIQCGKAWRAMRKDKGIGG